MFFLKNVGKPPYYPYNSGLHTQEMLENQILPLPSLFNVLRQISLKKYEVKPLLSHHILKEHSEPVLNVYSDYLNKNNNQLSDI